MLDSVKYVEVRRALSYHQPRVQNMHVSPPGRFVGKAVLVLVVLRCGGRKTCPPPMQWPKTRSVEKKNHGLHKW